MDPEPPATDATPVPPADAAPDWAATTADIVCPMCEYNLRGLAAPRCPECGYAFRWTELLDPNRRLHPYLFEHHPERNVWSFWKTAIGGLRPWRFWSTLHPTQPSNLRRLLIYWFIAAILMLGALAGHFVGSAIGLQQVMKEQRATVIASLARFDLANDPAQLAYLDYALPLAPSRAFFAKLGDAHPVFGPFCFVMAIAIVWPWATFLTLSLFRWSMRRAKVRSVHVLRCSLYACDLGLWVGLLAAVPLGIVAWSHTRTYLQSWPYEHYLQRFLAVAALMFLLALGRLTVAYAKYLRFHLPFATVFTSQLILVLLLTMIVVLVDALWHGFRQAWVVSWFL